jgi:Thioredoxin-like
MAHLLRAIVSLLLVGLCTVAGGCKQRSVAPPPVRWETHFDAACRAAKSESKPLLIHFYATWDVATKELLDLVFPDPGVRAIIADGYVALRVDRSRSYMQEATDEASVEADLLESRLHVATKYGPVIIVKPDCVTEADRIEAIFEPRRYEARLREARARGLSP